MPVETTQFESRIGVARRLRTRSSGKDDRTLIEDLVWLWLGLQTLATVQQRNDVADETAARETVRAHPQLRRNAMT